MLVNQFVGFLAGWNATGGLGLAAACALMASWCTFAPSYLWIFAGAPFAENLRHSQFAVGALSAITAAVLGVVANLGIWFSIQVVFARTIAVQTPLGAVLTVPVFSSVDLIAAGLAIAAGVALIKFKTNILVVISSSAVGGLLFA